VIYELHPEAALEHEEQVAFYERQLPGLGARYHRAFQSVMRRICNGPTRQRVFVEPDIRRVSLKGFPFGVVYRNVDNSVQVLAVAHHRRRPGYWSDRR
jgi:plasmid stabilization system protein ParE